MYIKLSTTDLHCEVSVITSQLKINFFEIAFLVEESDFFLNSISLINFKKFYSSKSKNDIVINGLL